MFKINFQEHAGELFAFVVGWFFCLTYLLGAYGLGVWLATYLAFHGVHPETAGLLSALALVWMYEHRNFEKKYESLRTNIAASGAGRRIVGRAEGP